MPGGRGTGTRVPAPGGWGCWETDLKYLGPQGQCPGHGWVPPTPGSLSMARSRARVSLVKAGGVTLNTRAGPCRGVEQQRRERGAALGANHGVPPAGMGFAGSGAFSTLPRAHRQGGTAGVRASGPSICMGLGALRVSSPIAFSFSAVARAGHGRAGGNRGGCRSRQRRSRQACW